jgi:hypothetical protein
MFNQMMEKNLRLDVKIVSCLTLSHKVVLVCSPTPEDDIARLQKVARNFHPRVGYSILVAKDVKQLEQSQDYTFLYIGPTVEQGNALPCLDLIDGFKEFAVLSTKLHLADVKAFYAGMGKKIQNFKDLGDLWSCKSSPPWAEIFGRLKNWSVQLRYPSHKICPGSYFHFFGIEGACFHKDCKPFEEESVLQVLK